LAGQGHTWHNLSPALNDFLGWFLAHWLLLLPLVAWPVLLVAVAAEYVIAEVVLPRFCYTPMPLRIFGLPATTAQTSARARLGARVRARLEAELAVRQEPLRGRRATQRPHASRMPAMERVPSRSESSTPVRVPRAPDGSSGD